MHLGGRTFSVRLSRANPANVFARVGIADPDSNISHFTHGLYATTDAYASRLIFPLERESIVDAVKQRIETILTSRDFQMKRARVLALVLYCQHRGMEKEGIFRYLLACGASESKALSYFDVVEKLAPQTREMLLNMR